MIRPAGNPGICRTCKGSRVVVVKEATATAPPATRPCPACQGRGTLGLVTK